MKILLMLIKITIDIRYYNFLKKTSQPAFLLKLVTVPTFELSNQTITLERRNFKFPSKKNETNEVFKVRTGNGQTVI